MHDISKRLSTGEREILRNQRLIMMALVAIADRGSPTVERLMKRIMQMDRDWSFIATDEERTTLYDQPG